LDKYIKQHHSTKALNKKYKSKIELLKEEIKNLKQERDEKIRDLKERLGEV